MVACYRFPQSVASADLHRAALLSKSVGRLQEATSLLIAYLEERRWLSVSGVSFLGTLLAEQNQTEAAIRTLSMAVRLSPARHPPVHTLSMLAALQLRVGRPRHALVALRTLLGHVPADTWNRGVLSGRAGIWREYGTLGDSSPQAHPGDWLAESRWDVAGDEAARDLLHSLQFPPREQCKGRALMLHSLGDRKSGWGMGSMLHELAAALSLAVREQRTLVLPSDDQWWYAAEDCRPQGFGCYFEALSSCVEGDSTDVVRSSDIMGPALQVSSPPASCPRGALFQRSKRL